MRLVPPDAGDPDFVDRPDYLEYNLVSKNIGELGVKGFEIESKLIPSQQWYITGAYSYQENKDQHGVEDTTLAPSFLIKLGAGYTSDRFSLGLFNSHYDEFKDNYIINPDRIYLNEPSKPYDMLSLNAVYHVNLRGRDLSFELMVNNLLDDDARIHQLFTEIYNTIPSEGGRAVYLSVSLK
jgi:outer membrane receptor for ferrienterochelin and colicin